MANSLWLIMCAIFKPVRFTKTLYRLRPYFMLSRVACAYYIRLAPFIIYD